LVRDHKLGETLLRNIINREEQITILRKTGYIDKEGHRRKGNLPFRNCGQNQQHKHEEYKIEKNGISNYTEHSPSSEADSCSADQEIIRIL
jgi:hypothetical protein